MSTTVASVAKAGFPRSFYVANGMEIFERLAWYGFFTVSSVYMTTPVDQGGVGFTESQRGALQGIIPFFLYILPVITGALADRYGFKRMFLLSFGIMAPSYYLLGQASSFGGFFVAFFAVALGAACFKPVVQGTISLTTNASNRSLGFGIFYTMVNIGGFAGPFIAGHVRAISWDAVFLMSTLWICINFFPAAFLYRDPRDQVHKDKQAEKSLKEVLQEAQEVLGNARFAMTIFPCIILLMCAGADWLSYLMAFGGIIAWLLFNVLWDRFAQEGSSAPWWQQKIHVSNVPFAIYLGVLSGFWAIYNQLFYTLPLFLRDYIDTADIISFVSFFGQGAVNYFASVNVEALTTKLEALASSDATSTLSALRLELVHLKVMVPESEIATSLEAIRQGASANQVALQWQQQYRQVNPEYIINIGFAMIILGQIAVSYVCQKFKAINVIIAGVVIFILGLLVALLSGSVALGGSAIVLAVVMMSFGEMVTVPKSQEYVANIAPKNQAALYMGYYFVSMALGFLFAGLLSGWGYGTVAKEWGQPELMWGIFAAIGLLTSAGLWWFNRRYVRVAD
ncbi:MFS transporter [uncultured Pseudoteredinibacter sp.]|uniref:MFS transporter n=1 Tax=uncultured Pseudoteredinibacter sp. TaxID=1641701 RepID=UPI002618985C|nr:MFS transporter [uncultured Pseudoteredinibacter sp.]